MSSYRLDSDTNHRQNLCLLLAASVALRLLFLWLIPQRAMSVDLWFWWQCSIDLSKGVNPYVATTYLNWPPHWFLILALLTKVAALTHFKVYNLIRVVLIGTESLLLVVLYWFLVRRGVRQVMRILMYGIALNPICIFLVCQHCNHDIFVALYVVLFVSCLDRYFNTGQSEQWLAACLWLGLGIFAKTIPLVLTPLLAPGWKRSNATQRWTGAFLVLAPVTIGVGVLLALNPDKIWRDVVCYHSTSGWFGINGTINSLGLFSPSAMATANQIHTFLFELVLSLLLIGETVYLLRADKRLTLSSIVTLSFVNILFIPTFGMGYGSQYIHWVLPLGIILFALRQFRVLLVTVLLIAEPIYFCFYAFSYIYGQFLWNLFPVSPYPWLFKILDTGQLLGVYKYSTIANYPLFLAYLFTWFYTYGRLSRALAGDKPAEA